MLTSTTLPHTGSGAPPGIRHASLFPHLIFVFSAASHNLICSSALLGRPNMTLETIEGLRCTYTPQLDVGDKTPLRWSLLYCLHRCVSAKSRWARNRVTCCEACATKVREQCNILSGYGKNIVAPASNLTRHPECLYPRRLL